MQQSITPQHIQFLKPAEQGFFPYKEQQQKCLGLIVGQIRLPIVPPHSNVFFLICDNTGEYHWVERNKVSLHSPIPETIISLAPSQKASWFRFLYNGSEPENTIQITGELARDGTTYVVFQMSGELVFNDGLLYVSICRTEDGQFLWRNDHKVGIADSFIKAWGSMPALVTNPDDYEESPIFSNDLPVRACVSDVEVIAGQTEF